jgi:hypothetical protein
MLQAQPSPPFFAFRQYTSRDFIQTTLRPESYSRSPDLSFEPIAEGRVTGLASVAVSEHCTDGAPYVPDGGRVVLSGTGVSRYSAEYGNPTPVEPGTLRMEWGGATAGPLDLGRAWIGAAAPRTITVLLWNDSARPRTVRLRSNLREIAISPDQATIEGGGHISVTVRFRPSAVKQYVGIIEAAENRTQMYSLWQYIGVSVKGEGVAAAADASP